jgi:hypothetical protein
MPDQSPASLAGAEAMFVQYTFDFHGGDATTPISELLSNAPMLYNPPMNFEHLIQINDPDNPLIVPLTREQLWQGLLHRVDNPVPFLPGLETCTVVERTEEYLLRDLDFGPATIRDKVTLAVLHWVRFDILPSEQHPGGSLSITIEEPEPAALFLRFAYRTTLAEQGETEDSAYVEYVKSAYHQSDVDCVKLIRQLAQHGSLQ